MFLVAIFFKERIGDCNNNSSPIAILLVQIPLPPLLSLSPWVLVWRAPQNSEYIFVVFLESCAVEPSRVDCISVSCIYGFYTTRICISNYINNVHFIEYSSMPRRARLHSQQVYTYNVHNSINGVVRHAVRYPYWLNIQKGKRWGYFAMLSHNQAYIRPGGYYITCMSIGIFSKHSMPFLIASKSSSAEGLRLFAPAVANRSDADMSFNPSNRIFS